MQDDRTLSREPTPERRRAGRRVATGFTYLPADQVPGAVLSHHAQQELQRKLLAIDEAQARARASAATYVLYR